MNRSDSTGAVPGRAGDSAGLTGAVAVIAGELTGVLAGVFVGGAVGLIRLDAGSCGGCTETDGCGVAGGGGAAVTAGALPSNSAHAGSARTRRKSSLVAASVLVPICARRCSMTSASLGRPLKLCARANKYISVGSFFGPFCTARQAKS